MNAWDLTTGSPGVIVADLDTGVRYDHPDLLRAMSEARLLPGFDFISDRDNANDGDGWDPDPSDPGDWVTAAEAAAGVFGACQSETVPGMARASQESSARWQTTRKALPGWAGVAGSCRARRSASAADSDSDILAAMLWSGGVAGGRRAGEPVSGANHQHEPRRERHLSAEL